MTSNVGSAIIQEKLNGFTDNNREKILEETKNEVIALLKSMVRPEFLNRIDEVIMFNPLTKQEIRDIVKLSANQLMEMMAQSGYDMRITDEAIDWLAKTGYDPQYGARPLKRLIQREIVNKLSKLILADTLDKGKPILVLPNSNELSISQL
jgi:ATP-dependent Clp protease ATP-binding subunit ClpB